MLDLISIQYFHYIRRCAAPVGYANESGSSSIQPNLLGSPNNRENPPRRTPAPAIARRNWRIIFRGYLRTDHGGVPMMVRGTGGGVLIVGA